MEHLTLIIPAKNEKESLPDVLSELKKYNLKIIVVLEKEDLDTINSIKEYDCKILHQINKGYGDALVQGLRNVKTNFFCFFNADGSFNPNELKNMYDLAIKGNADFIFGSRYMSGALSQDDTIITLIGNKIFTFIGKKIFSKDTDLDLLHRLVIEKNINPKSKSGNQEKLENIISNYL